ncbi:hypothetical protein QUB33_05465 [Microcoleus sp. B3-A4]|uniref:hypothetical protein n=1 Tax=Microcoleus sp. B3-A4 TaxID=2818653 RepID=UPI002FD3F461
MDNNLYRRIVQYAIEISGQDSLPWPGLYTARSVYNLLKKSPPLLPEEIGAQLGNISAEYVNQIILALQTGEVEIEAVPTETAGGRPKVKYTIGKDSYTYYILVSPRGFDIRKSSQFRLNILELIGTHVADVDRIDNEFIDRSAVIFANKNSNDNLSYLTKTGKELRGLFVILSLINADDLVALNSTQVRSIVSQLV